MPSSITQVYTRKEEADMPQNKKTKGLLIDLDGTLYHGNHRIPGADELIRSLKQRRIPYMFVTNNSSRTAEGVAKHLNEMGIEARPEEVCTSSLAAAEYIAGESPGASVAMLGEEGLRQALSDAGLHIVDENPQYVVQGIDRFLHTKVWPKPCSGFAAGQSTS